MFASILAVLRLILAELEKISENTTPATPDAGANDAQE